MERNTAILFLSNLVSISKKKKIQWATPKRKIARWKKTTKPDGI